MTDIPSPVARRTRRRHPARGARILSTGLSIAAMFGVVAALGVGGAAEAQEVPLASGALPEASMTVVVDPRTTAPQTVVVSELSNQPIQLTAAPVVRAPQAAPAPAQAAPVVRTNGSR